MLCRTDIVKQANPASLLTTHIDIEHKETSGYTDRDSSVGIATRYGYVSQSSSPSGGGGRDFPYPSRPALKPTMGTFFPQEKRP